MQKRTILKRKTRIIFLICVLLSASMALSACIPTNNVPPLIYGVWDDFASPLNYVVRVDPDGQNKAIMAQGENGIFLFQFLTRHNYSAPLSADGNYLAVYLNDSENQWTLNLAPTTVTSTRPVYTRIVGEDLARYIEGFSPTGRYYAYTIQDPLLGTYSVEVVDLNQGELLPVLPNSFFVDYFFGSDTLLVISVTELGGVGGIQQVDLPSETVTTIFTPPEGEELGLVVISPDGQYLVYYELLTHTVYRIPLTGGEPEELYTFEGTENSVNYDPDGNYLVLYNAIDQGVNHLVLLDQELDQVFESYSLGSSNLVFSADGHYLAWLERVNEGLVLNVTDLLSGETTLISDAASYYRAEFLPGNMQILYIQYAGTNDKAGELMIANMDGSEAIRLDMAVTSYQMTGNGELLYWKVDAVEFTSTLNRIGLDGNGLVEIMGPEPGVCAFLR